MDMAGVKLTELVEAAGCAAKLAPGYLSQVLAELPRLESDKLLVGFDASDDAYVYDLGDGRGLVGTTDFFPPMVDDPFLFGQVAAANALSDVWAMGGTPVLALNLLCFPNCLGLEVAGTNAVRRASSLPADTQSTTMSQSSVSLFPASSTSIAFLRTAAPVRGTPLCLPRHSARAS